MKTTCTICKNFLKAEVKYDVLKIKIIDLKDYQTFETILDIWCPECKIKYRIDNGKIKI